MTLQWTLVASFLYIEMAFLILLMLPFIPPTLWVKIFKSRFIKYIEKHSKIPYYACGGILLLLFFEAIRETKKYGSVNLSVEDRYATPHGDTEIHMRLFRAERNLFISGFTLFLYLVCRRMVQMVRCEAKLMNRADAAELLAEDNEDNTAGAEVDTAQDARLRKNE